MRRVGPPDATVGNIRLSNEVVNEQMERTMILSKKEHIHNVARVASAGVLVLGLAACDQIQSLWKTEKDAGPTASNPVTQTGQAAQPVEPKIELAKAPETSKAAAPVSEDAALAAKVKSALRAEPALKKSTVDIGTSGGVVTLYGTADTRANRERAAQVASNVPGVKSVKNEMIIVSGS